MKLAAQTIPEVAQLLREYYDMVGTMNSLNPHSGYVSTAFDVRNGELHRPNFKESDSQTSIADMAKLLNSDQQTQFLTLMHAAAQNGVTAISTELEKYNVSVTE